MSDVCTRKRKASMMVILDTASWKSLWIAWCITLAKRSLIGSITIDHIVAWYKTNFDELCMCVIQ